MIVWLASYPRSGNTLTRIIVSHVLEVPTPSVYAETERDMARWSTLLPLRDRPAELSSEEFVEHARQQDRLLVVKTHGPPPDTAEPAIVLVRDGRAAAVSYEQFFRTHDKTPYPLEQIVIGADPLANWSDWYRGWSTRSAPTLILRYEEIVGREDAVAREIGDFIGIAPLRTFDLSLTDMKAVDPAFFSVAANERRVEVLERRCPDLFWAIHGDVMRQLGYAGADERMVDQAMLRRAFAQAGRALHRIAHASAW